MRTASCPESRGHLDRRKMGGEVRENSRASGPALLLLALGVASLASCTLTVPLAKPVPSQFQYTELRQEAVQVVVRDARSPAERKLSKGMHSVEFVGAGEDLAFLSDALVAEMKARGINAVADAAGGTNVLAIDVDRFYFRNRRTSGFSPWITFTNFRAKVTYQGRPETVTSYFHAGKVPMWSMDEIFEPTYNYPWRVVVREVVTKVNRLFFNAAPPANLVRAHARALEGNVSLDSILDAGFLGSSEVLPALESLVKTSTNDNIVVYALDAIGIIGDPKSFSFLRDFYATSRERGRMLSLKAIGDLGTPEALSFVRQQPGDDDNLKEIIALYTY